MISTVTRHGILISNEVPHTYKAEIDKVTNNLRSRFTEDMRRPKTREQRALDREEALKVYGIFEFDMFHDFVMIYRRHANPVRVSPAYMFVIQRPPALCGISGSLHQLVIESITETLPADHYVYGIFKNTLAQHMKDRLAEDKEQDEE